MKFKLVKNKKMIVLAVVIVFVIGGVLIFQSKAKNHQNATVATAKVKTSDLTQIVSLTGTLKPNQEQTETLLSTKKVTKVYKKEGDSVKAGDIILTYDQQDITYQLERAQENLKLLNIQLAGMKNNTTTSEAVSAANTVDQSKLEVNNAQSAYDLANRTYSNNKTLYDQGFLSKEDFLTSEKALNDAKNRLENAKLTLSTAENTLKNAQTADKNSQTKIAQSIKEQQQQIVLQQVEIDSLESQLKDNSLRALIDGVVIKNDAKDNTYPAGDQNTVQVADLSSYKISVNVNQYDSANIHIGQTANITVKGIDGTFEGTVSKIGYLAKGETGKEAKVNVEIQLLNPSPEIKSGFEGDVDLIVGEKKNVPNISYEAIQKDTDGSSYVFVLKDGKAKKTPIQTGLETDFNVEVVSGLTNGQVYIVNPTNLKDGDPVTVSGGKQ